METSRGQSSTSWDAGVGEITLRYWAGARAAAGVERDVVAVQGPVTVARAREHALALHPDSEQLARVLAVCSVLVDDQPVGRRDPGSVMVPVGAHVEFLPPFAGG
ncbi:MoaD/ThiS family protein [Nocardioides sp. Y6]|uniref:MoaD/ThiS family protein n=1 Tax=Nocardioides malaquae TaxID=2773426 RepID=A0ABR9RTE6_9ACTN|nr:MoaD/ThiS family protein [Nocardioides malaquae]MBE7324851.1 MoaD/ThiS family protein [Nocardioides malaquae]